MSHYAEAKGASLKQLRERKQRQELDHIRVHAHEDGTPENPKWVIAHHNEPDGEPAEQFEFSDGGEMLAHVAKHAHVPAADEPEVQ